MSSEPRRTGKAQTAALFNLLAAGYDHPALRLFPFAADRLVDRLAPQRGEKVLDVATGTGAVALAAAQAVGRQGRVHGIDLAEAMLERAQQHVRKMALDNVDLHVMDAEQLEFRSAYFDVVACSLSLFFLPDPLAALQQWRRVLKPGGRVGFTTFGPDALRPQVAWLIEDLRALGYDSGEAEPRLAQPQACHSLLAQAGFDEPQVRREQLGYHLRDAGDWWDVVWNSALRALLLPLSDEALAALRERHLARVATLVDDNGLWLNVDLVLSRGRRPS